jgi:hypothetical protein
LWGFLFNLLTGPAHADGLHGSNAIAPRGGCRKLQKKQAGR